MTVTAPVRVLWSQLEGLEHWGVLDGREHRGVRDVLRYLCHAQHSKAVVITGRQLAKRVGLSEKWTRRCLHVLEALGIVRWTRGHIEQGRPRPGWITVRAGRLAQVVRHARDAARTARAEHRRQTDHRISTTVRNHTLWPRKKRHNPLSDHAELSSSLPLSRGKDAAASPAAASSKRPLTAPGDPVQACVHDLPNINACALCRRTLAADPTLDVRTLYKHIERTGPPPAGWRARTRALARQAAAAQDQQELPRG